MNGALLLLALLAAAFLATFTLDRLGRHGYGLISGSEFLILGVVLGPVGLDLLPLSLLSGARAALSLACGWLGFRFGLRLRPQALRALPKAQVVHGQVEALVAFGLLWASLAGIDRAFALGLSWQLRVGLAALGSATTKSALVWLRGRHQAEGPVAQTLAAVTEFDDLPAMVAIAWLFARLRPAATRLPPGAVGPLACTLVLGVGLAALGLLLLGRGRLREDNAWVALLGLCALGCGLSHALGLSAVAVGALLGAGLAWLSPHAEALAALTLPTERPAVQGLLLLGGAWLPGSYGLLAVASLFAALRALAKLASGAVLAALPGAPRAPTLGAGLLASGGLPLALAFSCALELPTALGTTLLAGCGASIVLGDLVGAPALHWLLARHGELSASGTVAPARPERA